MKSLGLVLVAVAIAVVVWLAFHWEDERRLRHLEKDIGEIKQAIKELRRAP